MKTLDLNQTPSGNRPKFVIAGCRNAGKSSFINAITEQEIAIVSDVPGTTADPVYKAMELHPIGPVTLVDTAGFDDKGKLGTLRKNKTFDAIKTADFVFLIISAETGVSNYDKKILDFIIKLNIPFAVCFNKIDRNKHFIIPDKFKHYNCYKTSAITKIGINKIKNSLSKIFHISNEKKIIADLISPDDIIILVVPIDLSAPKGRIILPQVQTIREILDANASAVITKENSLQKMLSVLKNKVRLVVTDSQVIKKVAKIVPQNTNLTTFSILFARFKGNLDSLLQGINTINILNNNDKIIILEACTHHVFPDDIGRIKIPNWLENHTGKKLKFDYFSGTKLPSNLKNYKLAIHCGGCMINQKEMEVRLELCKIAKLPVVNYGVLISYLNGAFPRVIEIF